MTVPEFCMSTRQPGWSGNLEQNDWQERENSLVRRELDSLVAQMYAGGITYNEAVREFKKRFLTEVLLANRGNQCKAARDLKVHRNTLSRMIDELAIDLNELRNGLKRPPRSERLSIEMKRTGSGLL